MFKLLHREKKHMQILKDLQGESYKFYRGKSYDNIAIGRYFCSCFDIAKSYRLYDESPIIETEIAVRNPLVIDATLETGYCNYEYLHIHECRLYPENKRKKLIKYIKKVGGTDTLSTDEVLRWAMKTKGIDAVIIKNVREGINDDLPIYDVTIWNKKNLANTRNVVNDENKYEMFRANTFKRVDLSLYISENEQDGVVSVTEGEGYIIEHTIESCNTKWYVGHELVIKTDVPVEIYCLDTHSYVTVKQLEKGVYENTAGMTKTKRIEPCDGVVRVKDIMENCKYKIEV